MIVFWIEVLDDEEYLVNFLKGKLLVEVKADEGDVGSRL